MGSGVFLFNFSFFRFFLYTIVWPHLADGAFMTRVSDQTSIVSSPARYRAAIRSWRPWRCLLHSSQAEPFMIERMSCAG